MHALICHDDFSHRMQLKIALKRLGFLVSSTPNQSTAQLCLREQVVDVVIMSETVGGKLTHALALLAECRNPNVETVLLTPRTDPCVEELYFLLPSLHCIVGPDIESHLIAKLARSAVVQRGENPRPVKVVEPDFIAPISEKPREEIAPPRQTKLQDLLADFA